MAADGGWSKAERSGPGASASERVSGPTPSLGEVGGSGPLGPGLGKSLGDAVGVIDRVIGDIAAGSVPLRRSEVSAEAERLLSIASPRRAAELGRDHRRSGPGSRATRATARGPDGDRHPGQRA